MTDQRTKRPKIKRLDLPCHLFFHGIDRPNYDAATDANMEVLTDVPVFQNNGWFLLRDGKNVRSWYQIKGKPCITHNTRKGCNIAVEMSQEDMIRNFALELHDATRCERELGREATELLVKSLRGLRKIPDAVYGFVDEQRTLQELKDSRREFISTHKAWRERKK
jgi:hypothetical protein